MGGVWALPYGVRTLRNQADDPMLDMVDSDLAAHAAGAFHREELQGKLDSRPLQLSYPSGEKTGDVFISSWVGCGLFVVHGLWSNGV